MQEIHFEALNFSFLKKNNNKSVCIKKEGIDFYFYLHLMKSSNQLVAFSNGAIDPSKKAPPIFMRSSWADEMSYNAVFIDDRTVHDTQLKLGWGIGTKARYYLEDYSEIVKRIADILKISSRDVYYYGSSAGGYMSIALAALHENATAIANNPQAYVYKYFKKPVTELYESVFPGMTAEEIQKKYSTRLSLTALFKREHYVPTIFYFQNRLSEFDMVNHYNPFISMLDKYELNTEPINFICYHDKESGHAPLSKDKTLKIIENIMGGNYLHL